MAIIIALILIVFSIIMLRRAIRLRNEKKVNEEVTDTKSSMYEPIIVDSNYDVAEEAISIVIEAPERSEQKKSRAPEPQYLQYIKARNLPADYVVLDFETTGLSYKNSKIIQVAAVQYKQHKEVEVFTTCVNPHEQLSDKIKSITGLTDEDLSSAPTIEEILPNLVTFIGDNTIVAHNASFDMKFFLYNLHKQKIPYKKYRVIDTLTLARKHIETDNHKLITLKQFLKLDLFKSHDALHDCYVTGELYKYCHEKSSERLIESN